MELNSIFFESGIIDIIFDKLNYNDKNMFLYTNKYTYQTYHKKIKYMVYDFVNQDYSRFKRLMKRYTYTKNELKELGIRCIIKIPKVRGENSVITYNDLRYIFELVCAGLDYHDHVFKGNIQQMNLLTIMNTIKYCISFDRFETIRKVNQEIILYPLHRLFIPRNNLWEYI